jgi:hypothetical protein
MKKKKQKQKPEPRGLDGKPISTRLMSSSTGKHNFRLGERSIIAEESFRRKEKNNG